MQASHRTHDTNENLWWLANKYWTTLFLWTCMAHFDQNTCVDNNHISALDAYLNIGSHIDLNLVSSECVWSLLWKKTKSVERRQYADDVDDKMHYFLVQVFEARSCDQGVVVVRCRLLVPFKRINRFFLQSVFVSFTWKCKSQWGKTGEKTEKWTRIDCPNTF